MKMKVFIISTPRSGSHHLLEFIAKSLGLNPIEFTRDVELLNKARYVGGWDGPYGNEECNEYILKQNRSVCIIHDHQLQKRKINLHGITINI